MYLSEVACIPMYYRCYPHGLLQCCHRDSIIKTVAMSYRFVMGIFVQLFVVIEEILVSFDFNV